MTQVKWIAIVAILAEVLFWGLVIITGKKVTMKILKDKAVIWAVVIGAVVALIAVEIIIRVIGPLQMSL